MQTASIAVGLVVVVLAGVLSGGFSLALKFTPRWQWEHTWGGGALMALLLVPWPTALLTVPDLFAVYRDSPTRSIVLALSCGVGWGLGGIFFGMAIRAVGLALGLSLIFGLIAVTGSLVPLWLQDAARLSRSSGQAMLAGLAVMSVGLVVCGLAGRLKGAPQADGTVASVHDRRGLLYCVLAGALSALVNFAFVFGRPIARAAVAHGATPMQASNAIWALTLTTNFATNLAYCIWLMREWRGAGRQAGSVMGLALAILLLAVATLGWAGSLDG